jgi:hypothetical protein
VGNKKEGRNKLSVLRKELKEREREREREGEGLPSGVNHM